MTTPVTQTKERPADPRTHKTPARDIAPGDLLRKIQTRIQALQMLAKRADDRDGVFAAWREGRPCICVKSYKYGDTTIAPGEKFHPGYEFIPRFMEIMNAPTYGHLFVTEEYYAAGKELSTLNKIVAELTPLVTKASMFKGQASQARADQEAARIAESAAKARAEQAEKNLKTADAELNQYVSGLTFDI